MATLNTRIILRNDATEAWEAVQDTAVLLKGEIGIEFPESGTPKFKIGDGTTAWINLGYATLTPEKIKSLIGDIPTEKDENGDDVPVAENVIEYIKLKTAGIATDENLSALSKKVDELEKIEHHTHANKEELDKISTGDVAKWNAAEANAKTFAQGLVDNLVIPEGGRVFQKAALSEITEDKVNGDIAIITTTIADDKKSRTAYIWDVTIPVYELNEDGSVKLNDNNEKIIKSYGDWVAFDGNYSASNVYIPEAIELAGDYGTYTDSRNDTVKVTKIGNKKIGDTFAAGTSLQDILLGILSQTIQPTISQNPSASISASGSEDAQEAGASYDLPTATLTVKSGAYECNGKTTTDTGVTYAIGDVKIAYGADPDTATYYVTNTDSALTNNGTVSIGPSTYSSNAQTAYFTDDYVSYTFSGSASHGAGSVAKDNLDKNSNPEIKIAAGTLTVADKTVRFRGYRKMFIRTTTDKNPTVNSTFFRASGAKISEKAAKSTKTFVAKANDVSFFVAIPTALTTAVPTFNYKFFGEWKTLSGVETLTGTTNIEGASTHVDAKPYKVYKYTPADGYFTADTEIQVIIK